DTLGGASGGENLALDAGTGNITFTGAIGSGGGGGGDPYADALSYWTFDGDANDSQAAGNDGTVNGAGWTTGQTGQGLSLDGDNDYVEVGDSASLDISSDITISIWVKKDEFSKIEGVISKGPYAIKVDADNRPYFELATGSETLNSAGSAGSASWIGCLTVYEGNLYATTNDSGQVYRYDGGTTWNPIGTPGSSTSSTPLVVYDGKMYAGTNESAKIYRYDGASTWTSVGELGGGNTSATSLVVYEGDLYSSGTAFTVYKYDGGEGAGASWSSVGAVPREDAQETFVPSLSVFNGELYAGTSPYRCRIYHYEGGTTWASVGRPPYVQQQRVNSFVVYDHDFYAGGYNYGWVARYNGNDSSPVWTSVNIPSTHRTESMTVYNGMLYAGHDDSGTGKIHRYDGSGSWTYIGQPGYQGVRAMANYDGKLFIGAYSSSANGITTLGDGLAVYSDTAISSDWAHVSATYDGTTAKLYVNGTEAGSQTKTMTIDANDLSLLIGSSHGSSKGSHGETPGEDYLDGVIDEVAIWNRALDENEIQSLYSGGGGTGTPLGDITITSAASVTCESTVNAASFTQTAGTGTTTFDGQVDLTGVISVNTDTIDINAAINTGGTQDYTSSASTTYLGGDLTSTDDAITFNGPVVVTANVVIDTVDQTGANIEFLHALDGSDAGGQDLTLTAGTGDIKFMGPIGGDLYGETGVIGYWNFDDELDPGHDSGIGGNDGELRYGPLWTSGKVGGALSFDGSDDYVSIPDNSCWAFGSDDFTISAWAKLPSVNGAQVIMQTNNATNYVGLYPYHYHWNAPILSINASPVLTGTEPPSENNWYHIVGVGSGGTAYLYMNGVLKDSDTYSHTFDSTGYKIGEEMWGNNFSGTIDEVAIWDRALTETEIKTLYGNDYGYASGSGVALGDITINSAGDVTTNSTVNAASFTQSAGTGTTTFDGQVDLSAILNVNTDTIDINAAINTGGTQDYTSSASTTYLGANLTSTDAAITFSGPVVLTANVAIDTVDQTGGNITFNNALDSDGVAARDLTLTTGTGEIIFSGAVGAGGSVYSDALGYWKMDDGTGVIATDSEGSNDGDLIGNPEWVNGKVGGALSFDGDDYVDMGNVLNIGTGEATISAWIYANEADYLTVVAKRYASYPVYKAYQLGVNGSGGVTGYIDGRTDTTYILVDDNTNYSGQWIHAVTVIERDVSSTTVKVYVDGTLKNSGSAGYLINPDNSNSLYVGLDDVNYQPHYFNGAIDEVAVWNRALDVDDVKLLHGAALGDVTITSAGNVTVNSTVNAASFTQTAGTGTTEFKDDITTTGVVDITTSNIKLGGDITTTNAAITFDGPVVLTTDVALSTDISAGNIEFLNALAGTAGTENLTLTAGTGDIKFMGPIGGNNEYGDAAGYWSFNDEQNLGYDSADSNHLILEGNASWTDAGKVGGALYLDGNGDYAHTESTSVFEFGSGDFSIGFWAYCQGPSSGPDNRAWGVMSKWSSTGGRRAWQISITNNPPPNKYSLGLNNAGVLLSQDYTQDQWQHFVFLREGDVLKVYENGVLFDQTSYSGTLETANVPMAIGKVYYEYNGHYFYGSLDEVAVWDSALEQSKIESLWNNGDGYTPVTALGAITVTSAGNVTCEDAVNAASFTQSAGTGTTTFDGQVDLSGILNINTDTIDINAAINTGGIQDYTSSGSTTYL
ncbi:LamG-like jellyroll fold domain-containing protein, partial [Candidatus Omnitrophota bacterium]